ncbi:hypothetical protein [Sulfitobacter sp. 1A13679]|uniref:hypothetical protein n=1 Tax=Sulfitobacter sp. 1A13679 TaxID=3368597 RepID=UPI003745CC09
MQDTAVKSGLAALCAVSGMAALGLTDNFVPFITERGSLWQFHFVRGLLAVAILMVLAAFGFGILRPRRFWAVAARSLFQADVDLFRLSGLSAHRSGGCRALHLASFRADDLGPVSGQARGTVAVGSRGRGLCRGLDGDPP